MTIPIVFSQRAVFHLIRDHHMQHGAFFSKSSNRLVEESGNLTIRTVDQDDKEKIEKNHIDLPPDVSKGAAGVMLLKMYPKNVP